MAASEAAIQKLLFRMGFSSVVYEPDGNIPPDFVIDGRIAVEVRRLNQNFDDGSGMRAWKRCPHLYGSKNGVRFTSKQLLAEK